MIRYLGPTNFGLLSYAISFAGIFTAISTLGLDSIIVRELVNYPSKRDELLGSTFYLKLFGAFLSIIFIGITLLITSEEGFTSILILIISSSVLFQTLNIVDFYFQAKVEIKNSAIAQFIGLIISSLFKVVLILLKAQLIYFAFAFTLEFFLISIGFVTVYKFKN